MHAVECLFWAVFAALAYVYVVYPAVMIAAAALPRRRRSENGVLPTVTLVIPAHNEAAVLDAKLRNARAIDYPAERLDVIVVSDGSTDETVSIARRFEGPRLRVLDLPRGGKASALNRAAAAATGDVLCLCDANVMFRPDAVRRLAEALDDPRVGAATGDVLLASEESDFGTGESVFYRFERAMQLGEFRVGSLVGVDGGMYVIRRPLFRPLPADTILDDFAVAVGVVRQGFDVAYVPAAQATENGTPTSREEFRRRIRVAAGSAQSLKRGVWPRPSRPVRLWQYLSHKPLRWLTPYLMLVLSAANLPLAAVRPVYAVTLAAQAAFYVLAAAAWASQSARGTVVCGTPYYFLLGNAAMIVGHTKGLLLRQSGKWERTARTPVAGLSDGGRP